jgi:hypothetical protein
VTLLAYIVTHMAPGMPPLVAVTHAEQPRAAVAYALGWPPLTQYSACQHTHHDRVCTWEVYADLTVCVHACRLCIRPSAGSPLGVWPPGAPCCACGCCCGCCAWCAACAAPEGPQPQQPHQAAAGGRAQLWQQLPGGEAVESCCPSCMLLLPTVLACIATVTPYFATSKLSTPVTCPCILCYRDTCSHLGIQYHC